MGSCFSSGKKEDQGENQQAKKEPINPIPMTEVKKHRSSQSLWIVIKGKVYDVTKWQQSHPGGSAALKMVGGRDCTAGFSSKHGPEAWPMLANYCIGQVQGATVEEFKEPEAKPVTGKDGKLVALQPNKPIMCALLSRTEVSPDTRKFTFKLPQPDMALGVPVGHHILLTTKDAKGAAVCRSYTPITLDDTKGSFELVIKVYFKGVSEAWPEGGIMSQKLDSLKVGDEIEVGGPRGHWEYLSEGKFSHNGMDGETKSLGFIAGGSGITPCYQVIKAILENPSDKTKCWLVFSNKTEADILLRPELDEWAAKHPDRFKVHYTVSEAPAGWKYSTGRVSKEMLTEHMPTPGPDTYIGLCGPQGFVHSHCVPLLIDIGHDSMNTWAF
uniref:Cytochrome-b5 reductase n=1 Tax=Hemiselmis andersenii TaxID=464988 RepID=A0A6U4YV90_HEMAN|mmetsp:Transcript_40429/g.98287  ORF Transcript_40429/g.98287 Transcript_40429/m.98287 type:complete len:384 (-) Transcript_40429:222-1373(-)